MEMTTGKVRSSRSVIPAASLPASLRAEVGIPDVGCSAVGVILPSVRVSAELKDDALLRGLRHLCVGYIVEGKAGEGGVREK